MRREIMGGVFMVIIIADDDKLIRAGIKKIILDNLEGEHEIIEAKNGKEAIEQCEKFHPQVIITDIQMPGINGVELMQQISQWEQRPSIIVLSGFNDFNYTKSALTSGAIDYILKPVDTNEILSALRRAMASFEKTEKGIKEKTLRKIIKDGYSEDTTIKGDFYCVCVSVAENAREISGKALPEVAEDFFVGISPIYILERRKNFFIALVEQNGIEHMKSHPPFECCAVGVSEKCQNLSELRKISAQAYSALLESFFADEDSHKTNGIYRYFSQKSELDFNEIDRLYEKFIAAIDTTSYHGIQKFVNALLDFEGLEKNECGEKLAYIHDKIARSMVKRYAQFQEQDSYLYTKSLMIENLHRAKDLSDWKKNINDYAFYVTSILRNKREKYPFITKAVLYVQNHFDEEISMTTVANEVNSNYTWFSEKFKEQVGMNFNDYLKNYRMEQAKALLEKGIYRVYEVSEKVGFKDVKYFMKTFHQANGMSPGKWMQLHEKK